MGSASRSRAGSTRDASVRVASLAAPGGHRPRGDWDGGRRRSEGALRAGRRELYRAPEPAPGAGLLDPFRVRVGVGDYPVSGCTRFPASRSLDDGPTQKTARRRTRNQDASEGTSISICSLASRIAAAQVALHKGRRLWATLGNIDLRTSRSTRHFLTVSLYIDDAWFHLARYHDLDVEERGPLESCGTYRPRRRRRWVTPACTDAANRCRTNREDSIAPPRRSLIAPTVAFESI